MPDPNSAIQTASGYAVDPGQTGGMYYPAVEQGHTIWIPVPPGSPPAAFDRPRSQIPAGADIRDPEAIAAALLAQYPMPSGPVQMGGDWYSPEVAQALASGQMAWAPGASTTPTPYPGAPPVAGTAPPAQTAASTAAAMLYNAMRGLPYISQEFLSALQAGQAPAPRTVTPQTLSALAADSTLSDAFFSVIKANALYPESYLAEIGRYIPKGKEATPSFI